MPRARSASVWWGRITVTVVGIGQAGVATLALVAFPHLNRGARIKVDNAGETTDRWPVRTTENPLRLYAAICLSAEIANFQSMNLRQMSGP